MPSRAGLEHMCSAHDFGTISQCATEFEKRAENLLSIPRGLQENRTGGRVRESAASLATRNAWLASNTVFFKLNGSISLVNSGLVACRAISEPLPTKMPWSPNGSSLTIDSVFQYKVAFHWYIQTAAIRLTVDSHESVPCRSLISWGAA
jgi:hypothetical protein